MQKRMSTQKIRYTHYSYLALLTGLICLATFFAAAFPLGAEAHSLSQPGGNVADPVVRAVDIAKPSVVRIVTNLPARLTVNFSTTQSVTFPQGSNTPYPLTLSGSGTFISSNGDILTADHVVNPPHDQALAQFLFTLAAPDIAQYMNQTKQGSNVTPDQVVQLLTSGQLDSQAHYDQPSSEVYLSTDYTGPISANTVAGIAPSTHATVDKIEKESSFNEKDVAIIHVPMTNIPRIQLGDSSNVQQQDDLTIIGFPGNADISTRPTDLFSSSINKITVSSIKSTDTGAPVIQVGGNVEHGDSGGPALDSQGQVVGIVSFGLANGNSIGSTTFLQASNSAKSLITALGINTQPGSFDKAWTNAFADYASTNPGHWHRAQQEFQQLAGTYPNFKAVTPYLDYTNTQASHEKLPTTQTTSNSSPALSSSLIAILVVVLILLLALLILFFVVRSSQRKRKQAKAAATNLNLSTGQAAGNPVPPVYSQPGAPSQPGLARPGYSQPSQPGVVPQSYSQHGIPFQPGQPSGNRQGEHDVSAFGGPPSHTPMPPYQGGAVGQNSAPANASGELHPWPCGHMNRPNARFCSICGEPGVQEPTIRRYEQ